MINDRRMVAGFTFGVIVAIGGLSLTAATPLSSIPVPTPTSETGDSTYNPSNDNCSPDAYRIGAEVCDLIIEIGDPVHTDDPVEPGTPIEQEGPIEIGDPIPVAPGETVCGEKFTMVDGECRYIHPEPTETPETNSSSDCRYHGDRICSVVVEGVRYQLNFKNYTFRD